MVKLTHYYLDLYIFYHKEPASVSNVAWQRKSPLLPCLGCSQVWSFSMDQENEGFSAKLSLNKGEYKRCAQIEHHQLLFKFFLFSSTLAKGPRELKVL